MHWELGSAAPVFETIASHGVSLPQSEHRNSTAKFTLDGDYVMLWLSRTVILWDWMHSEVLIWKLEVRLSFTSCTALHI